MFIHYPGMYLGTLNFFLLQFFYISHVFHDRTRQNPYESPANATLPLFTLSESQNIIPIKKTLQLNSTSLSKNLQKLSLHVGIILT